MTNLARVFGEYNDTKIRWNEDISFPIWVAKDVGDALDLNNVFDSMRNFEDYEKATIQVTDTLGRKQNMTGVTEPGLYRLIFSSRKPEAEEFKKWVFREVLPEIRRTGSYTLPGSEMDFETKLNYIDKIQELTSDFAEKQPRLAQALVDHLSNDILGPNQLPSSEHEMKGAVEIADSMGYKNASDPSTRTKLGRYLAKSKVSNLAKKENRLCNGVQRPINCYPDCPQVRKVIEQFFS